MQLPNSYLTECVTLEQVLEEYDFKSCHADFKSDWERLLGKRADGDEFWRFAPPPGHIKVWGIALVRNGEVVSTLIDSVG
jgi:hypothetical protein